ncbi:hypothetical protein FRC02_006099 [Tulasnella sp. 418]|nr:hypothetical protein FRC02_006099 [Tulasnella sp. 418]
MAGSLGKSLLTLSSLALLHAAFSTYEHFSQLKALGRSEEGIRQLPWNIVIECFLSLFVFIIGVTLHAPPLKEITWASEMRKRTIEEMDSRPSFAGFNHRGKILFGQEVKS